MFVWVIKMLQYQRIDVSERIDINKSNKSKKCMICFYLYFKDIVYKFEPHVCNKCHNVSTMAYEIKKYCNTKCKRWWL